MSININKAVEEIEQVGNISEEVLKDELKKKRNKPEDNIIYISQIKTDNFILEQIAKPTTLATLATPQKDERQGIKKDSYFIKYNKKTGETETIDSIKIGNYIYKPINSDLIDTNTIYLPTNAIDYGTTDLLLKEIKEYLNIYFEVDTSTEKILASYVLFTWVFEKFPFVPYIQFIGRTATGKTTAAETLVSICYKGIDATGATSESAIFRTANDWGGVLFLDEFEAEIAEKSMVTFLKSGVSDRAVLKTEVIGKNYYVKPYMVKSPKIFTSEKTINDGGLKSRVIEIKMEKNKRRIPLYKLPNYFIKGQELRNKLLMWRFNNLDKVNLSEIEFGIKEMEHIDRRVQQVLTPIYFLSQEEGKRDILEFAKEQEEETKESRRNTEEGLIFNIIYEYYENENMQPSIKLITNEINKQRQELGYKTNRTEKKIAEIIRKLIGFNIDRLGNENISTVLIEENEKSLAKYQELLEYYGLPSSRGVASVANVADVVFSDIKEEDV